MESQDTYWADLAALEWQVELGADEALSETPIDRYALEAKPATVPAAAAPAAVPIVATPDSVDAVAAARTAAEAAPDLAALATALADFELCEVKRGARNAVFAGGDPAARVMVLGEAPGRDEDRSGQPFQGDTGRMLDRMFAAIGLSREADDPAKGLYLSYVLPWRLTAQQAPAETDIAMMVPFLERHIALANPDALILFGNTPCRALLGKQGIGRLRGTWTEVLGRPALPMLPPDALLRQPLAKREAWADLLSLQARLRG